MIEFFKNEYSHTSSALSISEEQKKQIQKTRITHVIGVESKQLDGIFDSFPIIPPTLLELGVQGFEKNVLLGAKKSLSRIDYLLFEVSFVEMYDGEPLFEEMHNFVKSLGFSLVGPVSYLIGSNAKILQMDMFYKRK